MTEHAAFVALTRFGLGARPGERAKVDDPKRWLQRQMGAAPPLPAPLAALPTTAARLAEYRSMRGGKGEGKDARETVRGWYRDEMLVHQRWRLDSEAPFHERWVAVWGNHFAVSIAKAQIFPLAGPFEREAIRPHATGRFEDMLLAVTRHPAMLLYLDNARSTGPDSPKGRRKGLGLNENLAREILELHTLGVDGGYGQADVEALAAMLTGWTVEGGRFAFDALAHQPGTKVLLGKSYAEAGEDEARQALLDLAHHPSTAKHVARRLCRHFVADTPPAEAVDRIAMVFTATGGSLADTALALVDEPTVWTTPLARIRPPADLVTATGRLLGFDGEAEVLLRSLFTLGQPPWGAPSPAGWSDLDADWIGPQAVLDRIGIAHAIAEKVDVSDPRELAADVFGSVLSAGTEKAVRTAPSAADGLALLLASPEHQRR